ncbi:MAG TPA: 2Fe-2S iron-sulfur cluster-binding protein, partial [Anaerolineae bacterium]|nr:2Fe-2S iron-sulfur cluster-binding protein [Anaerolineae bacterium]
MSYIVDFEPVGRRGSCPEGGTLLDAARALGIDLASLCGGHGSCVRCRVQIVAGEVTPVTAREADRLPASDLALGYRLAC